jgi:catechol 2,3-dioxygenase-like lactoylglutathione lyase family enzyme
MPIGIDHIVIAVDDLATTTRDYTKAGFTVVEGGQHHSGASANVLVAFQDGTYLELIAFSGPSDNPWAAKLAESGEGLVDVALRTDDLDAEVAALTGRGLHVIGPTAGGRVRPDGQRVDWRTIRFEEPGLPFYCHDDTDRNLRVPHGDQAIHANGIAGVASIALPAADLDAAATRWQHLTGLDGNDIPGGKRFAIGTQAVDLIESDGTRPLHVVVTATNGTGDELPIALTHGARFIVSD